MTKTHCQGCYNDVYNYGLGGAKHCWSFPTAKLVKRKLISIHAVPPWTQKPQTLPSCYLKQGYVCIDPKVRS